MWPSARQLRVLIAAVVRELTWTLPAAAGEVRAWRSLARVAADAPTRMDALSSLARKRGHIDGAAIFTILPRTREHGLLRLLVAYEITWDFLDSANEHGATAGQLNGRQLHLALRDALDCGTATTDYYRFHPWRDDGGYLRGLVATCRQCCMQLPAYESVRSFALEEANCSQVLGINHELNPLARDIALREWALAICNAAEDAAWFELTGAASASLTIHALLALAAEAPRDVTDVELVRSAYFPWISAATTMLDSFVDQLQDAVSGDHSYVRHYASPAHQVERISELIERSLRAAGGLPDGERHRLIVACMAAMYLSKDCARSTKLRKDAGALLRAGGGLTQMLLPVLRMWRIAYSQRGA